MLLNRHSLLSKILNSGDTKKVTLLKFGVSENRLRELSL